MTVQLWGMTQLAILLHMHQPDYRHPETGRPVMPWARLHALRGYRDVPVEVLENDVSLTVNLVPSLLDQLMDYAAGARDEHLDLTERAAASLSPEEIDRVRSTFIAGHPAMIQAHPAYEVLRRRVQGGDALGHSALRDLQVWSTLAWFGATALRDFPALGELQRKGAGFSEAEKAAMLAIQRKILEEIPGLFARLAKAGRLSASPCCHPILPLLVDTAHARRCMPQLPDEVAFRWPEDAALHLRLARDRFAEVFGVAPLGLWPSEGSVSPEVVKLAGEAGFRWLVTDEEVLHRSDRDGARNLGAWDLGHGVRGFFRDHELSDRIGFQYARWNAEDAVADLLGGAARRGEGTVVIALDGENPWEAWADAGAAFRAQLFDALKKGPHRAVSLDEAALAPPVGVVHRLHTGSWINADFHIWYGHADDRAAWRRIAAARAAVEAAPEPRRSAALRRLLPAEGSDWMWWYGDDFSTPFAPVFDQLFREHLRGVYRTLGVEAPADLDVPIGKGAAPPELILPTGPISPRLEAHPRWLHWYGAGEVIWPPQGAMARVGRTLPRVRFGWSHDEGGEIQALWLRIGADPGRVGVDASAQCRLQIGALNVTFPCAAVGTLHSEPGVEVLVGQAEVVVRLEARRLPFEQIPLALSVVGKEGVRARFPDDGSVWIPRPPAHARLSWWAAP